MKSYQNGELSLTGQIMRDDGPVIAALGNIDEIAMRALLEKMGVPLTKSNSMRAGQTLRAHDWRYCSVYRNGRVIKVWRAPYHDCWK